MPRINPHDPGQEHVLPHERPPLHVEARKNFSAAGGEKPEFFVWTYNFQPFRHACSYYRIEVPLSSLVASGNAQVYETNPQSYGTAVGNEEAMLALMFSDIMQQYSLAGSGTLHRFKAIKSRKPAMQGETLITPPAIVYDVDDNADFVHPFNYTFPFLGVRAYPSSKLLTPGDTLRFERTPGNWEDLWVDKETKYNDSIFDIERNLYDMKVRHECIRTADAATVSTRALASYFRDVIGQKNVYVYPNTVVPSHYEHFDVRRKPEDEGKVRILWQGSASHFPDWAPLREAIAEVAQKYRDKVKFVFFGQVFDWVHKALPKEMMEVHPWTFYEAYKIKRALLNCDINLCPLKDDIFNRSKSAIKWYEGSLFEEATLAQKTEPFHEIEHGKTGMLFSTAEEFVQMLSELIENADLRKRLGRNAKRWVLANRTPEHTTPGLYQFYREVRDRQKSSFKNERVKVYSFADLKKLQDEINLPITDTSFYKGIAPKR